MLEVGFVDEERFRDALTRLQLARSEEEEHQALEDIELYGPVDLFRGRRSRAYRAQEEPPDDVAWVDDDVAWVDDDEAV